MLGRRRTGSVVCPGCGKLVGAAESRCPFCGRPAPAMFGLTAVLRRLGLRLGLWPLIGWACGAIYLATLLTSGPHVLGGGSLLNLFPADGTQLFAFGASGPLPVLQYGRWWTVLSAGWLHGNLLHIAFNLYGLAQIAPAVEHLYGTGRALVIYTLSSVAGFLASSLSPFLPAPLLWLMGTGSITVGASASLFGLLGALIHYSRRGGSSALGAQVWSWAIGMFAFGLLRFGGLNVDSWAHLGGFLGGWLLAFWLDPLRPERLDHLLAGLLCLLASAGAIVWSLVTFQQLAR